MYVSFYKLKVIKSLWWLQILVFICVSELFLHPILITFDLCFECTLNKRQVVRGRGR